MSISRRLERQPRVSTSICGYGSLRSQGRHRCLPQTNTMLQLPRLLRRLAAAVAGRLVGDPRVVRAIGQAGQRLAAAEEEFRTGGIADRPVAGGLVQFQE